MFERATLTAIASAFVFTGSVVSAEVGEIDVVLKSGDPVPGVAGATISFLNLPTISNGHLASQARIGGPSVSGTSDIALFSIPAGQSPTLLAREGSSAGIGGQFGTFEYPVVGRGGHVAFKTLVRNVPAPEDSVMFRVDGSSRTIVAREGRASPTGGTFTYVGPPVIDAGGDIYFSGSVGPDFHNGIFRHRPDGSISAIARTGDAVPGVTGETFYLFRSIHASASGDVVANAELSAHQQSAIVLKPADSNAVQVVASTGTAPPTGPGSLLNFSSAIPNSLGEVAIYASLDGPGVTNETNSGIYLYQAGALRTLAREDDPAPGTDARFNHFSTVRPNDAGQVGFVATLRGDGIDSTNDDAIFVFDQGRLRKAAQAGDAVGTTGARLEFIQSMSFNNRGQAVFDGGLVGPGIGADNRFGIFMYDPDLGLLPVARRDQPLLGSRITYLTRRSNGDATGTTYADLDADGTVVFNFTLSDGTNGIGRWSAPDLSALLPGDANLDGTVDLADFVILRNNFGTDDYAYFTTGDFNGDHLVDLEDFVILRNNFGDQDLAGGLTVPEPAGMAVLLVPATLMLRRRSRSAPGSRILSDQADGYGIRG